MCTYTMYKYGKNPRRLFRQEILVAKQRCVYLLLIGEEDQMTADVTTMATWGDSESTSSSSDESEEDEDTPNDEAEIDEEDDGMFTCC